MLDLFEWWSVKYYFEWVILHNQSNWLLLFGVTLCLILFNSIQNESSRVLFYSAIAFMHNNQIFVSQNKCFCWIGCIIGTCFCLYTIPCLLIEKSSQIVIINTKYTYDFQIFYWIHKWYIIMLGKIKSFSEGGSRLFEIIQTRHNRSSLWIISIKESSSF
jgi:hypothetical protein